jgi:hypothetical protein
VGRTTYFGALTGAFRTKAGALRLRVLTGARSLDGQPGWLTVVPEGVTSFVVTRLVPPAEGA